MSADARLVELGLQLPPVPKAMGLYKPMMIVGNLIFTSGHVPLKTDGTLITGCVGSDVDREGGYAAARQSGLAMLATLKENLGSLDRVRRVVKVLGMVNCTAGFTDHPSVINGFSELLRDVFGEEIGIGARSAVGVGSLPGDVTTEIEAVIEFE